MPSSMLMWVENEDLVRLHQVYVEYEYYDPYGYASKELQPWLSKNVSLKDVIEELKYRLCAFDTGGSDE